MKYRLALCLFDYFRAVPWMVARWPLVKEGHFLLFRHTLYVLEFRLWEERNVSVPLNHDIERLKHQSEALFFKQE